jgi:hypothetical protein
MNVPLHNGGMRRVLIVAVLTSLSLGLGACSKCDTYRFMGGPKTCSAN